MESSSTLSKYAFWLLLFFAAVCTASIAAQNSLWIAVLVWLAAKVRHHEKIKWPRGLFPLATVLFLIPFFTSAVFGIHPSQSFHTIYKYLTFLLIFFIAAMEFTLAEIRKLLLVFTIGSTVCAVFGISMYLAGIQARITSFSGYFMIFGGLLMSALLIQIYFIVQNPRKIIYWAGAFILLAAFVLNQTRGAWLGFALGFLILTWFFNRRLLLAGLALAFVGYFFLPAALQNRVQSIGDWKDQPRVFIWKAGVKIIKDYPVMGIGQGNLSDIYPRYVDPAASEKNEPHLHDNFLQIQVQNGVFGLAAYLFWIFAYFYSAWRYQPPNPESRDLNRLFACLFTAALVWGLTEYTFSHQFMYFQTFLFGLQCSLWSGLKSSSPKIKKRKK